jgi:hypothetical protein
VLLDGDTKTGLGRLVKQLRGLLNQGVADGGAWWGGCAALAATEQGNRGERESGGGAGWGEARLG